MGKFGGRELNYASDVDVLFVTAPGSGDGPVRRLLDICRQSFRVDADLRPDGRAGSLTRSVESYRAYWDRWAQPWEFQALLKARPVAGSTELGRRFIDAALERVWERAYSADELAQLRTMKARAEELVVRRGLVGRELKRGPGGIRDVEFAVQLLQLVHGRFDRTIRSPSTLQALAGLAAAGYVAEQDADALSSAYRFLRTVEHRVQLVEGEQTHAVPPSGPARRRLARVLGFGDDQSASAESRFDDALRRCLRDVRTIHERLFFRPLLESFAALEPQGANSPARVMDSEAVAARLAAFGFADAARTRAAVEELAGGLTRSSQLMAQLLPLLLDWLSLAPDPDLGLIGLRNLTVHRHHRSLLVTTFRESPEAARRLCLLLGSSRVLSEAIGRNPELIARIDDDQALASPSRAELVGEAVQRLTRRSENRHRRAQLLRIRQDQLVRTAARDLLEIDTVSATGRALTTVAEALLEAALGSLDPDLPICLLGMGRFGGAELSYASDLDLLLVHGGSSVSDDARAESLAETLLRLLHGSSPSERALTIDLGLRPEGGGGRLIRNVRAYGSYFERWGQTWERQALLRARIVAGDRELGGAFMKRTTEFVWGRPLSTAEVAEIRRMKARIERERVPAREDPQFHLKLGRGSLSDVEWTVQLLQLRHHAAATGTMEALDALARDQLISDDDATALSDAYRFCERTRNRWFLVGSLPGGTPVGDSLPAQGHQLSRLARSLGTTPAALRDDYRRVTRRCRRVVERLFYGIERRQEP
jgi:glutamate-ammonia-ligase adenylyltransferase